MSRNGTTRCSATRSYHGETFYIRGRENTRQLLLDMLAFFDEYPKDDGAESVAGVPLGGR